MGKEVNPSDIQKEAAGAWLNRSDLEKALSAGLHGAPELGRDEKKRYLGEFRERVFKTLSRKQVVEPGVYPAISEALKDKRVHRMVINGDIDFHLTDKYSKLARKAEKEVTIVSDPEFTGDTGLVLVGKEALDVEVIAVEDRKTSLARAGVPEKVIEAAGKKLCEKCLKQVLEAAPEEKPNYGQINLVDSLCGEHCPGCKAH